MILRSFQRAQRFGSIREKIKQQRQTRLGKVNVGHILPVKTSEDLQKIRNIGIIAHIDAGKTTSTQRMLYYAGALPSPGDIDEGTTTMDYMQQERQRGITIRSAAISFNWKDHQINLIDTPGHVDFSAQVTRSLEVLDGAVTILDAVKGVEAQTIKVWEQANRKKLPKLCFLNKMDRIGSSILQSAESIKKRLKAQPLIMQYPVGDGDTFRGVVDLITLEQIIFKGIYGQFPEYKDVSKIDPKYTFYQQGRMKLVEQVGSFDDQIGDMCLNQQYVPVAKLKMAIRKILLNPAFNDKVCPLFIGSAYRNKGMQPLLNAIIEYLPSPSERAPIINLNEPSQSRKPLKTQPFTGYIFKMIYDVEKGPLAYTRVYSGLLRKGTEILNSTKNHPQKITQIYRVRANQYVNVNQVSAGDIVAISGFKQSAAGDTIIDMNDPIFVLDKIPVPTPVFVAPFQLDSSKHQRQLLQAMERMTIQDNSITYKTEIETGQFLVNGLGQLHLEIIRDRLVAEGIPIRMGNLKINYKETINKVISKQHSIEREDKAQNEQQFHIQVQLSPHLNQDGKIIQKNVVRFQFQRDYSFDECWEQFVLRKTTQFKSRQSQSYDTVEEIKAAREQAMKMPKGKKSIRNPTPMVPMQSEEGGDEQDAPYYHISTLPFETLYQLVESSKISLMYGKHNLPVIGVELRILNGKYRKESFNKPIMNQCAQQVIRQCVDDASVLMEPMMEIYLKGEPQMIQIAMRDTIKKRGRIQQQLQNQFRGYVPAEGVKGWIKHLRSMGFEVDLKFSGYEEVQGTNPTKLLQQNL